MTSKLHYSSVDPLPENTQCFQLDDGTVFYYKYNVPQNIYLTSADGLIYAKLPSGHIVSISAHGNALYFNTTMGKIYRATYTDNTIEISFVRNRQLLESVSPSGVCSLNGKYYPMSVDPNSAESNLVEISNELSGGAVIGMHKGRCVYAKESTDHQLHVQLFGASVIGLSVPFDHKTVHFYARDCSDFFYIAHQEHLYAINTKSWQALPALTLKDFCNVRIVGILDGVITFTGQEYFKQFVVTAKAPPGFFDAPEVLGIFNTQHVFKTPCAWEYEHEFVQPPQNNSKSVTTKKFSLWESEQDEEEYKKRRKLQQFEKEISTTINEFLDKNAELSKQIEAMKQELRGSNDDILNEFTRQKTETEEMIAKVIRENEEFRINRDRAMKLNEELEAVNDQLIEENQLMINEEKKNKALKEQMESALKENERLSKTLFERSELAGKEGFKKLITENEKIKRELEN